jgi:hypothetical protein
MAWTMKDGEMTCEESEALLPRELEGELSADEQSRVERHLTTCRRCWALREDLLEISQMARTIPALSPPRDLWYGVAARIEAPVIELGTTTGEHRLARRRRRALRLGAAAAAIVTITALTTYSITRAMYTRGSTPVVAAREPSLDPVPFDSQYFQSPEVMGGAMVVSYQRSDDPYDQEVAHLRALFNRRRPMLDSAIVALLDRNLLMIDQAIVKNRAALARNPGNALLHRQLNFAMSKKIQVLRTAVTLPVAAE